MTVSLRPEHSESSWRWTWTDDHGEHEIAYVTARSRWLKRFRPADPDSTDPPWTPTQQMPWRRPESEDDAEGIVREYVEAS